MIEDVMRFWRKNEIRVVPGDEGRREENFHAILNKVER